MSSCDDANVLDDDGKPAFQNQDNGVDRLALLDERFADYYATSRAWELKAFRATVTDWERERYGRTV